MVAELHIVVWGWCRSAGEAKGYRLGKLSYGLAGGPVESFQDGGFIEHDAPESFRLEVLQLGVVCHVDARANVRLPRDHPNRYSEFDALTLRLVGHSEGSEDQNGQAGVFADVSRPL